jgi:AraC-like DNA-binding protein
LPLALEPHKLRSVDGQAPNDSNISGHSVPGAQVLQLAELLTFWRIEAATLLADTDLTTTLLEEPNCRVPIETMNHLVARARSLTGEPALGVFMGLRRRVSLYGFLGFAAMSASSLGEALELAVKFSSMITTAIKLSLHIEGELAALRIEERHDPGSVRDVALFALVLGLDQIGKTLTGQPVLGKAQLAIAEPAYVARFPRLLASMRFDQPVTQLMFEAKHLQLPLITPDRAGLLLAREQCERALCDLGLDGAIVDRVRALIVKPLGMRSLEEVATELQMSGRTLKRRLAAQSVSFSALIEQERHKRANLLLASTQLSLTEIAERLGYSNLTNFARAYRRWAGKSPLAYRRAAAEPRTVRVSGGLTLVDADETLVQSARVDIMPAHEKALGS